MQYSKRLLFIAEYKNNPTNIGKATAVIYKIGENACEKARRDTLFLPSTSLDLSALSKKEMQQCLLMVLVDGQLI